jgi:hypothetical protein
MAKLERARSVTLLVSLAAATGGCFPFGDNEEPQATTKAQIEAALASCRVPREYLASAQGEIIVKFPDGAPNGESQRRCVDAYLQKLGVSVALAWRDGNGS